MKELVQEIDFYVELVDLEITNNLNVVSNIAQLQPLDFAVLPTVDVVPAQPTVATVPAQPEDHVA